MIQFIYPILLILDVFREIAALSYRNDMTHVIDIIQNKLITFERLGIVDVFFSFGTTVSIRM